MVFLIILTSSGYAQTYHFRNYTLADGVAQSEVYDILEDHSGHLWFATRGGGLNRFDGETFDKLDLSDGLASNVTFSIAQARDSLIWISTNNGVSIYDGVRFKTMVWGDSDLPTVVGDIEFDSKGRVWTASNKGIHVIDGDSISDYSSAFDIDVDYISFIHRDANDILWIGANNRLIKVRTWKPTIYGMDDGFGLSRLTGLAETPSGLKFISTYGDGLYIKLGQHFEKMEGLPFSNGTIHELKCDNQGVLWMATQDNGVFSFDPRDSTIVHLTSRSGLANDHVEAIIQDSWGNYWFGTGGGGLSHYYRSSFTRYDASNELNGDFIYSFLIDDQARRWVGTSAKGISVWTDSTFKTYNSSNGFTTDKTRVIHEDSVGNIWLAPEGRGLWRFDSTFTHFNRANSDLPSDWVKAITSDRNGNVWVAIAGYGITKVEFDSTLKNNHRFTTFDKRDGLPKQNIYALHCDKKNRIWFGANNGGMGFFDSDNIQVFNESDGLADNNVKVIAEDDHGYLWVGGSRLTRVNIYGDLSMEVISSSKGLTSNNVYQIDIDHYGNVWIGSETGVDRFTLDDNGDILRSKHFGHAEGFLGIETTHNASVADTAGIMWFGTIDGLLQYHPSDQESNTTPPKLSITKISLFYEPLEQTQFSDHMGAWGRLNQAIELNHDQNHLSFEFKAIDLANPSSVLYSWKLEGFDNQWSPAINKADATYSNLPPGEYFFTVRAMSSEGNWTDPVTTNKFIIAEPPPPPPPFWNTIWFRVTAPAILLLIIGLWLSARFRRIRQERERLKLEKEVIQLEQKALRLQMNPHFIFNVLNTIQALIGKKDEQSAKYLLAKFSRLMRATLENSRNTAISLEEEIEALEHYMSLEKFSSEDSFDFEIMVSDDLDPEVVAIAPMLVQPFVENAIIHGLKQIDRKGKIEIMFSRAGEFLECSVVDNGRGRKNADKDKAQMESYHKSAGLAVTQERLDILHGDRKVKSLIFEDLEDENGRPLGTKVRITVPYSELI